MTSAGPPEALVSAYLQAFLNAGGATLSTILNRSIVLELEPPLRKPSESITEVLPLPWMVAYARFTRGMTGVHHVVVAQKDLPFLTRLMLGEDSEEPVILTDEQEDRLHDLAAQISTSVSSSLKAFFGRPVAVIFADHQAIESPDAFRPHAVAMAVGQIVVEGTPRARFALTVPHSIAGPTERPPIGSADMSSGTEGPTIPGLDVILDISMPVTVELGRTKMLVRDILALGPGSVIELDKLAGEPVDLLVNERPIAKGEVVVIDENFGVRLTQISHASERLRSLS